MAQIQQSLSAYSNIGLWSTSGSESVHQKATLPSLKGSRVCQSQSSGSSEETFIIIGSPVYGNSVSHSQELTTVCYRVPVHDSHDKLIKSMQYLFCDLCFFPLLDCVALKKERKKNIWKDHVWYRKPKQNHPHAFCDNLEYFQRNHWQPTWNDIQTIIAKSLDSQCLLLKLE